MRQYEENFKLKTEELSDQINILIEQKNQLTKKLLEYETTVQDFHFDVKSKMRL